MKCGVFGLRAQAYLERRYNVWGLDKCRLEWLSIWQELPERVPRIVPAQAFSASYTRHPLSTVLPSSGLPLSKQYSSTSRIVLPRGFKHLSW